MEKRVDRLHRIAAAQPGAVSLGGGLPSASLFPRAALGRAFIRAMAEPQASALQYAWPEGRLELREWIAARLRARGADLGADDVIVTSGAQQAIAIAAQLTFRRGDEVGVDLETYPAALDLFRSRGGRPRTGWDAATPLFYAMPAIGNPHSRPMPLPVRQSLLRRHIQILEDDAYAELRFDGRTSRPLLADDRTRVWHIGSFSKTLCPGLRVGWLVPPRAFREAALDVKHASDLQASSLGQTILSLFLEGDDFDARLGRAQRFYRARAERLVRALRRHLPSWRCGDPEGGFAVFIETDEPGDDLALLEVATRHGVSFDPGRIFRPDGSGAPLGLRLCFSYAAAQELDEGVRRLARAWDVYRREARAPARHDMTAG